MALQASGKDHFSNASLQMACRKRYDMQISSYYSAHSAHPAGSLASCSISRLAGLAATVFRATSTSDSPGQGSTRSIRLHSHTVLSKILRVNLLIQPLPTSLL